MFFKCSRTVSVVAKRNFIPIDPDDPLGESTETCISVMLSFLHYTPLSLSLKEFF